VKVRLALISLLGSCALTTWDVPQPLIRTGQLDELWTRMRRATTAYCAGIETENAESKLLVGHWQAWSSADGLYLTKCMVSVLPEDDDGRFAFVRLTFITRRCGTGDLDDLEATAKTCGPAESIPNLVKTQLELLTQHFEADVRR
jgi:hypothetical protein